MDAAAETVAASNASVVTDVFDFQRFVPGTSRTSTPADMFYVINGICMPLLGFIGIIGNVLNLAILSWRYNKPDVDVLERSALLGLIALAVSDLCFCLMLLPLALYYRPRTLFDGRGFYFYYKVYGIYFQNIFIKTSTFLTMVIAAARYVGICHPLRARIFVGLAGTKVAILVSFVVWPLLLLPLAWTYSVHSLPATNSSTSLLLDVGSLVTDFELGLTFTYIWAILGFYLPLAVLMFCHINLIRTLRESRRLRKNLTRSNTTGHVHNMRITMTLIALILMFIVLVSPSELLHFYTEVAEPTYYKTIEVATLITNILQALNFAFHFVLYCVVNVTFRHTVVLVARRVWRKLQGRGSERATTGFCAMTPTDKRRSYTHLPLSRYVSATSNKSTETYV